jgi:hypothetical protein
MKLHQLFVVSILFFQTFSCFGMYQSLLPFMHTKAKLNSKNKQKIRNTQKAIAQLKAKTQIKPKIQRLLLPEPQRQKLINFCRIQLVRKDLAKIKDETAQLKKETEHIRKINTATNSENTKLINTINRLERETQQLREKLHCIDQKKAIQSAQIKNDPIKQHAAHQAPIIQKTNQPAKRKLIKRPAQKSDQPLTNQEKLYGLKILKSKSQYNVRETPVLLDKLREEADTAFEKNNPDFDRENHFFSKMFYTHHSKAFDTDYCYIFCPCTKQLTIVNNNLKLSLPNDFLCSNNCSFYTSKKVSSSNSTVDTSSETETESDTEEENLQPVLLSKEAIEKIAD